MPMDENIPAASPVESPPPLPYKDRSTGLIVFGIMTILLGCVAGLLIPLMLFGHAMAAKTTNLPPNYSTILPAIALYAVLAAALVWLGIGSIKARRWARALLLIFSWSWLFMGLAGLIFTSFFIPQILANAPSGATPGQPAVPQAAMGAIMVVMFLVNGVLFVVLPGAWTFFYSSRHVKATCETRDPATRWTDACPLPVLGLCLWLLLSVLMLLVTAMVGHGVTPFFGMFLTGVQGSIFQVFMAGIWAAAAWWLYKLDPRGWWLQLVTMCLFMASAAITFGAHDMADMYRLMGYSDGQLEQLQKSGLLAGNFMWGAMACSMLLYLGFLLYIKKFFCRRTQPQPL